MKTIRQARLNWFGDILCHPGSVVIPESEKELEEIVGDRDKYPSPVRAVGSTHSITPCLEARAPGDVTRWGTLVDTSALSGVVRIDEAASTVTAWSGTRVIHLARALRDRGLQIHVNTELGSLSVGAAACAATKDSSFPGEFGQVGSYAVGMRVVTADGNARDFSDAKDMHLLRCSYGLFGIASTVTFQVKPHQPIDIQHGPVDVLGDPRSLAVALAEISALNQATFLYLFPDAGKAIAERRVPSQGLWQQTSLALKLRNVAWRRIVPATSRMLGAIPFTGPRDLLLDATQWTLRKFLNHVLETRNVSPVDQIVDFDKGASRFTFSMWAFPEEHFAEILPAYFDLCRSFNRRTGYRLLMPSASYRIAKDQQALLSYSQNGPVWTLDPVTIGRHPKWPDFLELFNEFALSNEGVPLFNQTPLLDRDKATRAFGDRLKDYEQARVAWDPRNRFLTRHFAELLG